MSYVLLVEDNPDNATMMIRLLTSAGFTVQHFDHGLDGVKAARLQRPDLILMDFNLPDIDGRTLVLTLKKQLSPKPPPFIAVTARSGAIEEYIAKQFGCDAFISKPFEPQVFLDTVRQYATPKKTPKE
jgi:CheY-like chemotaxis protein